MPTIDVFSAHGLHPDETTALLHALVCAACTVNVWDVRSPAGKQEARRLGIPATPAVVVDGRAIPLTAAKVPRR